MMFRNDISDGLWLEDRSNSDVYMDDSIYKGVGDVASRPPPVMQTPKRGKIYVFGDSQTGGMRRAIRNYYKSEGYAEGDIIIKYKDNGKYKDIDRFVSEHTYKPGDQIIIASVGGNEVGYRDPRGRSKSLVNSLKRHQNNNVGVRVFGLPLGNRSKSYNVRREMDVTQKEIFKDLSYTSTLASSIGVPGKIGNVHYTDGQQLFDKTVKPGLSRPASKTPNIKPATPPKVASARGTAPAQTAGTRNPTPAQTTPAQTTPAQTAPAQTAPAQTAPAQTAAKGAGNVPAGLRKYSKEVEAASAEFGVPAPFIYAIMQTESNGNPLAGKEKHARNVARGKPNNQGLGLMQVIRSTFKGTTERMRGEGIANVPVDTEEAQYDPTNSIRVGTFILSRHLKLARKRHQEARNNPQLAESLAAMYYKMGPGEGKPERPGAKLYIREQRKKHGNFNPETWDKDPKSKTGHVRGGGASYAAVTRKRRNRYATGGKSTAPKTTTTAPKAQAPRAEASKAPASKPAPKAPEQKLLKPKRYSGERTDLPARRPGEHPTKYRGISRKKTRPDRSTAVIGPRRPRMHEGQVERFESKLPKIGVIRRTKHQKDLDKIIEKMPKSGETYPKKQDGSPKQYPKGESQIPPLSMAPKKTSPASRAMASVKRQPAPSQPVQGQNAASAGQRAMEQISSVKQQPTKRPSRFKSESFTPTRTV